MKLWFRNLVAIPLLGWLPLQAAALPALALLCEMDPSAVHGHAVGHSHHGDHEHGDGGHEQDGGSSSGGPHTCCHHFFSAALPSLSTVVAPPVSGVDPTPLFHPEFFIPEQPQPPPLARLV